MTVGAIHKPYNDFQDSNVAYTVSVAQMPVKHISYMTSIAALNSML